MGCSAHANCTTTHYCDTEHTCFPCLDGDGVGCAGHGDAVDGTCPSDGANLADCNPSGLVATRSIADADDASSPKENAGTALDWVIPLAIFGVGLLVVVFWAVLKRGQSEQDGPVAGASSAATFANPMYYPATGVQGSIAGLDGDPTHDMLGVGSGGRDDGGKAEYMDVAPALVGANAASVYADVHGLTRQESSTSTTHVQMGADDLYDSIPAESAYSELAPFGEWQGDTKTSAYMDVASVPVDESAYTDIAPEYGFGDLDYLEFEL